MKSNGLNEFASKSFVEISWQDAETYDIEEGALLKITSRRGEIETDARISAMAVKGTVFIPFHYAKASAKVLINLALDPIYLIIPIKISSNLNNFDLRQKNRE